MGKKRNADDIRELSLQYALGNIGVQAPAKNNAKRKGRKPSRWDDPEFRKKYNDHLRSAEWAEFKAFVIATRGHRCQRCKRKDVSLDLHHNHYKNLGNEKLEDVRLLCRACHEKHHGRKFKKRAA